MLSTWTIAGRIEGDIADVRRRTRETPCAEAESAVAEADQLVKMLGGEDDDVSILRAWRALDRAETALRKAQRTVDHAAAAGEGAKRARRQERAPAASRESSR